MVKQNQTAICVIYCLLDLAFIELDIMPDKLGGNSYSTYTEVRISIETIVEISITVKIIKINSKTLF